MALIGTFGTAYRAGRAQRAPRRPRTPIAVQLGRAAARLLPTWAALRTFLLTVAGLGLLTAAAWTLAIPAGLAVGGVSLLVLEWLLSGGDR